MIIKFKDLYEGQLVHNNKRLAIFRVNAVRRADIETFKKGVTLTYETRENYSKSINLTPAEFNKGKYKLVNWT